MKTQEEIRKRLNKLRVRYAHKYVKKSQERAHLNCVFNELYKTDVFQYEKNNTDLPIVPRKQVTLVVLKDKPDSIHICMYGSDNSKNWQGSICNSDTIAISCPMFKPRVDVKIAQHEFLDLMSDDTYVFENYRDIATLQWVIGERIHDMPLSLLDKFILRMKSLFIWVKKPISLKSTSIPEDIWDDSSSNTGS